MASRTRTKDFKILKPIEPKESWSTDLARAIQKVFKQGIYQDLLTVAHEPHVRTNAVDDALVEAIKQGKIRFLNGEFRGEFTASISRAIKELGGTFNVRTNVWTISLEKLPYRVQGAIGVAALNLEFMQTVMNQILEKIPSVVSLLTKELDLTKFADQTMDRIDTQFKTTVSDAISVQPDMRPEDVIRLDEGYVKSMTRPIKKVLIKENQQNIEASTNKFADEEVQRLRVEIADWVKSGKSRKGLEQMISSRLSVSKDRAKFIARQETSLFTAQFKQAQYQAAGIKKYVWDAMMDARTRPLHAQLDGKTFSWDNPPIIDLRTQEHGHPGEAFGCRCKARPVVEFG